MTLIGANEDLQWIVFSQLILIGEAANRIAREDQEFVPDLPWPRIIGLRNRLVHGYDSLDWKLIFETVSSHVPPMIRVLNRLLDELTG